MLSRGHNVIRRNTCLLCSRAYSQNENVTTIKDEAQDVEQTDVPVIEPPLEWKTLSGVPPFWIRTPVPMWKAAYAKLQIPTPKADAPTVNYGGIEVPKKVKRDSVTILKALSETQQFDDHSVNYNFIDDNLLYQVKYKDEALAAKLDGKKTAHQMMNMYKECFMDFKAQPDIPAFNPGSVEYEDKGVSVNALEERIRKRKVSHALEIYDRLVEKGVEIPIEVEEKMLELLCVFNSCDPDTDVRTRISYMKASSRQGPEGWKGGEADKIFEKHKETNTLTPLMYNVYVCGLIKHSTRTNSEGDKAFKLYKDMKEADIPVFMCTYNMMMILTTDPKAILIDMKNAGVVPNSETFLSALSNKFNRRHDVPSILAEMRKAGIRLDFRHMLYLHKAASFDLKFSEQLIDFMAKQKTLYMNHAGPNVFIEMMRRLRALDRQEAFPVARKLFKLRKEMGIRYKCPDPSLDDFFINYFTMAAKLAPIEEFKEIYKEIVPVYLTQQLNMVYDRMEKEPGHGDFLITLYEDMFNFLPTPWPSVAKVLHSVNVLFQKMMDDKHSPELKKQFADVASVFYSGYVLPELEFKGNLNKKQLLSSDVVKTSLELMLKEPSYLDKTWKYYMSHADISMQQFKRQVLSWEKIFKLAVQEEDTPKIRQFLTKINVSPSWANHDFLEDMRKPLENILGPEERAMLDHILASKGRRQENGRKEN